MTALIIIIIIRYNSHFLQVSKQPPPPVTTIEKTELTLLGNKSTMLPCTKLSAHLSLILRIMSYISPEAIFAKIYRVET